MSKRTKQGKCTSGKFKRVNYFHGMLLTEQDFQDEQAYLREKLKLHNRLHGYGVVWGLELKIKCLEVEGDSVSKVFLTPGLAIDCAGNEIVVCQDQLVPLDEKIEAILRSCRYEFPKLCVAIRYCECATNPETQYTAACAHDERQPNFARVREGFSLELLKADELPKCCRQHKRPAEDPGKGCCKSHRLDCPGLAACCEEEHVIVVGCLERYIPADTRLPVDLAAYSYTEKMIDPCFEPCRVYRPKAHDDWERRKRALLQRACRESEWVDFSGVVGREYSDASNYLREIGLRTKQDYIIPIGSQNPQQLMARIANATSCASRGSWIKVITDDEQRCVLFAFWEEEGNDE